MLILIMINTSDLQNHVSDDKFFQPTPATSFCQIIGSFSEHGNYDLSLIKVSTAFSIGSIIVQLLFGLTLQVGLFLINNCDDITVRYEFDFSYKRREKKGKKHTDNLTWFHHFLQP